MAQTTTSPFRIPKAQLEAVTSPPSAVITHGTSSGALGLHTHKVDDVEEERKRKARPGCNCKSTTRCLKRYCECFKLGENCTNTCRCIDCGNSKNVLHRAKLPALMSTNGGSNINIDLFQALSWTTNIDEDLLSENL